MCVSVSQSDGGDDFDTDDFDTELIVDMMLQVTTMILVQYVWMNMKKGRRSESCPATMVWFHFFPTCMFSSVLKHCDSLLEFYFC